MKKTTILTSEKSKVSEDIKSLVVARIKASTGNLRITAGSESYSTEDLVRSVEQEDDLGKQVIDAQMTFLRDLAEGSLYPNE